MITKRCLGKVTSDYAREDMTRKVTSEDNREEMTGQNGKHNYRDVMARQPDKRICKRRDYMAK